MYSVGDKAVTLFIMNDSYDTVESYFVNYEMQY